MNCGNLEGGAEAEIFHETLIWSNIVVEFQPRVD